MSGTEVELRRELSRPQLGGFLRSMLREPFAVGALAPSSRFLASLMVADMRPGSRVIEGVRADDLILIEQNEEFAELLTRRIPDTTVVKANAISL